ncbi:uncharacterized protein LOC127807537 [Diospyros lotus]|uniref:uncharacterized protein LOC127807537 n=1 Tax=Diospyros lotus TaxID=55363 RepID=UPI0022549014|nr:uncharacterized protein LOC127807537 [Diospyros lotus]
MENPGSPPKEQEPEAKKLKMSATASDDDDDATCPPAERKQRFKRRKIAIFFAYCGVGYQGMQKNPGAKTIEGDLEEALFFSGAVPEQDRGCPKRFDWARSARTDKGVSAVGQVVSGRFYVDPPGLVDRLNSNLPSQIRIFGYKRVTASFNAKKFCDRRRYAYLIPIFALDPSSHPNRETVLASLGSENELPKCLECSERGRKVVGVTGKRNFGSSAVDSENAIPESVIDSGISSSNGSAIVKSELQHLNEKLLDKDVISESVIDSGISSSSGSAVVKCEVQEVNEQPLEKDDSSNRDSDEHKMCLGNGAGANEGGYLSGEKKAEAKQLDECVNNEKRPEDEVQQLNDSGNYEKRPENEAQQLDECGNGEKRPENESQFCYGEKEKERFNRILKCYEGTHNFHNFTTRTKAEDPSARRYIVSFNANTTINVQGIEFVKCEVVGQSFMLHQIRKMIGLAVAIMRNCAPESLIETALQRDVNINVPTAPEVGLYLEECLFASYNQKWKDSHEELSMKTYAEEAQDFKMNHIYSHIASTEHKEGVVGLWLHSLNHRNYPDLLLNNGEASYLNESAGQQIPLSSSQ